MREPEWIRGDVVLAIHRRQLAEHGGIDGVRDSGLLESALARPQNLWAYSDPKPDISALAASYAFGIIKNHPFLDGNKRTGYAVCRIFLILNGHDIDATQEQKYETDLAIASSDIDEAGLVDWMRTVLIRSK
jgi:death-on-curing protein